jgi:hypothetical protein
VLRLSLLAVQRLPPWGSTPAATCWTAWVTMRLASSAPSARRPQATLSGERHGFVFLLPPSTYQGSNQDCNLLRSASVKSGAMARAEAASKTAQGCLQCAHVHVKFASRALASSAYNRNSHGMHVACRAYAKLAYVPCEPFLAAAALQLLSDLAQSVPQDISNATWAFATLRHHPGKTLMDGCAQTAARTMPHFKPQEIANTLW